MQPSDDYEIDTKTPSGARAYDYMVGGVDNYAVDRMAADQIEDIIPGTKAIARNNRRYLERVVRYLAEECGIRQFIDSGSGLPTQNNVHQIAQGIAPGSRVVYIDNDPVVLQHQKVNALPENENTAFLLEDARDVAAILSHPDTNRLIDFDEPVAVLYMAFLHFIPDDDDPWGVVRQAMSRLVSGSYLAISHITSDNPELRERVSELAETAARGRFGRVRKKQEIRKFFDSLDIVDPGLVDVATWRPDGREEEQTHDWVAYGGVARKP